MDAIEQFKQAGVALQQDPRYKVLQAARTANDEDETLQDLIGDFNLVRLDLSNELEKDPRDEGRVEELNDRINDLYDEIMTNPHMLAYNAAKQGIRGLVDHINAIVAAAIDGDDPMAVAEPHNHDDCGGSCSSCSGCG